MPAKTAANEAVTTTRSHRRARLALAALCAAVFVAALDHFMVYVIMKSLMTDLGLDPVAQLSRAAWIITGYLLGYTIAMPLFGRLADVKGRRLMTLIALLLFFVGSVMCVFIRRLDLFVVARVIQAAGGGALVPIAMAAAADMFPLAKRALMLGIVGGAAEIGSVLGFIYGPALALLPSALGLMTNTVYWPLIFMVNIPLCLLIGVACWQLLRGDLSYPHVAFGSQEPAETASSDSVTPRSPRNRWLWRGQVDYGGACLMALALACAMIGLGTGGEMLGATSDRETPLYSWPWLAGAAVAFILFVLYQRLHPRPLVRLAYFKIPAFAAANIANFLVGVTLVIGMAGVSLYGQALFDLSALGAGFLLLQLMLPVPIAAVIGGWLADRIGCKITAALGFLVAAVGYYLVSQWPVDPGFWTRFVSLVVAGIGLGFVVGPIGTSATSTLGPQRMATGAALVTVSRMVGMAIGMSAISSWGVRRASDLAARSTASILWTPGMTEFEYQARLQNVRLEEAAHQVFGEFFLIAAIVIAMAIIPAFFFYNHREKGASALPFLPH